MRERHELGRCERVTQRSRDRKERMRVRKGGAGARARTCSASSSFVGTYGAVSLMLLLLPPPPEGTIPSADRNADEALETDGRTIALGVSEADISSSPAAAAFMSSPVSETETTCMASGAAIAGARDIADDANGFGSGRSHVIPRK